MSDALRFNGEDYVSQRSAESALAAERARAEALAKQVEVERRQLAIAQESEGELSAQWLKMGLELAAERAKVVGLVALLADVKAWQATVQELMPDGMAERIDAALAAGEA
jgi:hypothetical protein